MIGSCRQAKRSLSRLASQLQRPKAIDGYTPTGGLDDNIHGVNFPWKVPLRRLFRPGVTATAEKARAETQSATKQVVGAVDVVDDDATLCATYDDIIKGFVFQLIILFKDNVDSELTR